MAILLFILLIAGFVSVKRFANIEKILFGGQFALIALLFVGLYFKNNWINVPLTILVALFTFAGALLWIADFEYLAYKFDDPKDSNPNPRQILVCPRIVAIAMVASYLVAGLVWIAEFGIVGWSGILWILAIIGVILFACAIRWAWQQDVWNHEHTGASGKEIVLSVIWAALVVLLVYLGGRKVWAQLKNPFDGGNQKVITIGGISGVTPTPAPTQTPALTETPTPTPPTQSIEEIVNSYSEEQILEIFGEPQPLNTKSTYPRWDERTAATGFIDAMTFVGPEDGECECLDVVHETITNDPYAAGACEALVEGGLLGESQWVKDFRAEYLSGKDDWIESGLETKDGVKYHTRERHITLCKIAIAELALQEVGLYNPDQLEVKVHWGLNAELEQPVRLTTPDKYPFWVYKAVKKDGREVYFGIKCLLAW